MSEKNCDIYTRKYGMHLGLDKCIKYQACAKVLKETVCGFTYSCKYF